MAVIRRQIRDESITPANLDRWWDDASVGCCKRNCALPKYVFYHFNHDGPNGYDWFYCETHWLRDTSGQDEGADGGTPRYFRPKTSFQIGIEIGKERTTYGYEAKKGRPGVRRGARRRR